MPFKIETIYHFPIVIPDASSTEDGVMTAAQAAQLAALVAGGSFLTIYTNITRPVANAPIIGAIPGVKAGVIWNSSDNQPNFSDGVNWYDAAGNLT
jgi:hypothetical protein